MAGRYLGEEKAVRRDAHPGVKAVHVGNWIRFVLVVVPEHRRDADRTNDDGRKLDARVDHFHHWPGRRNDLESDRACGRGLETC